MGHVSGAVPALELPTAGTRQTTGRLPEAGVWPTVTVPRTVETTQCPGLGALCFLCVTEKGG